MTPEQRTTPEPEIQYPYDALVVLGASMRWDDKRNRWYFPTIIEEARGKLSEGKARAIGAGMAFERHLAPLILVTGGIERDKGHEGSRSHELAKLIVSRYHVPEDAVRAIGQRGNTEGNGLDVTDFLTEHPEYIKRNRLGVLTNYWHLPRALTILSDNEFFKERGIELVPVEPEIMMIENKYYRKWVDAIDRSPEMDLALWWENKGMADYKAKDYKPTHS